MIRHLLALCLVASPAYADTEATLKHIGTGAAVGLGIEGLCIESARALTDEPHTFECFVITVAAASAAYSVKEFAYDTPKYHNPSDSAIDFFEGMGGTVGGALVFFPIAGW